jgi:pimeloyl-ACP methyl ester carboxylesterase
MTILNFVAALAAIAGTEAATPPERRTCTAPDGVTIVYSVAGTGQTALVFIHGGMADRSFFDAQLAALSSRFVVIALDLAGHGESGRNRKAWGMPAFGADVKAVVDAERLQRVVLLGNSLGGPAAVEAALLLPGRVAGVVGIDTFQDLGHPETPEYARAAEEDARRRAAAFRADYRAAMKTMVRMLFHPDANPAIVADAERRMLRTSPDVAAAMLASLAGYDYAASVRRLAVPLRTINGDLYPTDVAAARTVKADFDAVVMKHVGHYPMLERPDEFNGDVIAVVEALLRQKPYF